MNVNYPDTYTPPQAPPKRRNTLVIVLIAGLVLLLCCCVVAMAVIVIADPFDLHIKDRLFGGTFDAAAEAMPEDTSVYVGVNLLGATPDQLDRVIQPFADALNIDQRSWDEIIDELDRYIGKELDLTITDDIKPWIGQYVGLGVFDIRIIDSENPVSLIIAAESRDNNAADDFLRKLQDRIEEGSDERLDETEYEGVTIYALQPAYGVGLAFCRSGSLVLFSLDQNDLHTAIDAQKGKSLVDNKRYRDMLDKIPDKRVATIFFTSQEVKDLINELQSQTGEVFDQITEGLGETATAPNPLITQINIDMWDASILSISITGAGLQLDSVTSYNMDNISAAQRELFESMGKASKTIEMFPEDTLAFITSQRLDLNYDVAIETLRDFSQDTSDSIDNALQSVREETGIDLEDDLFYRLDGEFTIGIFPSSQGILAQQANVDLGFALLAESSDTGALANTMDKLASKLEEAGAGFERFESGDLTLYEFLAESGGDTVFAGGIEKDYMAIASSRQTIEDLFAGKTPLSKSSRYRDAISPLPDGVTPVLFLDVEGILGIIRESLSGYSREDFDQSISVLKPIPYIVMGYSEMKDGIIRMTLVIHVK
jgi:hypothetical protein